MTCPRCGGATRVRVEHDGDAEHTFLECLNGHLLHHVETLLERPERVLEPLKRRGRNRRVLCECGRLRRPQAEACEVCAAAESDRELRPSVAGGGRR